MIINEHSIRNQKFAEIITEDIVLNSVEDALDLIGNCSYQGYDHLIIYEKNITKDFFNLKTKLAGEILQKFVQYQMPVSIIGDFSNYNSDRLNDFILESNKGRHVHFRHQLEDLF